MKKLIGAIAFSALLAGPLIAPAQDRDGYHRDGRGGDAPSAAAHGYDDPDSGAYYYSDAYPYGGYGADYTYSYPDGHGAYQPFAYSYSDRDDAYYADDGGARPGYGDDRYEADPNLGWSDGGAPVDCGQWVWREGRGAYEWVARPCR
jgi:hypothetical protein